jgi:Protein of unknown function (DUF2946)
MDDLVRQAMAKWPNVPDCFGWLGLDARGRWFMRDDQAQAAGAFDCGVPAAKGSHLKHDKLIDFIHRNYDCDASGRWFFQNGPQRVFVELEVAPWIWRIEPDGTILSHTGRAVMQVHSAIQDEGGRLFLHTDLGVGLVHTQDVGRAADLMQTRSWPLLEEQASQLPGHYRYVKSP